MSGPEDIVIGSGLPGMSSEPVTTSLSDVASSWWSATTANVWGAASWLGARAADVVDLVVVSPTAGLVSGLSSGISGAVARELPSDEPPPAPPLGSAPAPTGPTWRAPDWVVPALLITGAGLVLVATVARPRMPRFW